MMFIHIYGKKKYHYLNCPHILIYIFLLLISYYFLTYLMNSLTLSSSSPLSSVSSSTGCINAPSTLLSSHSQLPSISLLLFPVHIHSVMSPYLLLWLCESILVLRVLISNWIFPFPTCKFVLIFVQ